MSFNRLVLYIVFFVAASCTKGYSQIPITFNVGSDSGQMGSTVCVDVTFEDFIKVTSTQFEIRFDPNVLRLITPIDVNSSVLNEGGMSGLSINNFNDVDAANGFLAVVWIDVATTGKTFDDDEIFFTLCFELIGEPCESSEITITESGKITFEFIQIDCVTDEENDFPPIVNSGEITIDPAGYAVSTAFCSSDDASNSGSITFAGSGGTGPYSWELTGGAAGSGLDDCEMVTIDDLAPGQYTLTLIDANNTVINEIITISTNSDFPFVLTLDGTNPTCFDRLNGSVGVVDIEGGEAPFEYAWSNMEFNEDTITQLGMGEYTLTITDVNGCTTSASSIIAVDTLTVNFDVISDPSCDGSSNGIVSLSAEGGTPFPGNGYDFEINGTGSTIYFASNFMPTDIFTPANLPSGCFEIVASDNATFPCFSDPVEFCIEAGSFSTLDIQITDISCFGSCDGAVVITADDMGNYSFMVTDPDGNAQTGMNTNLAFDADNLCAGIYEVTVNDVNAGCSIDTSFTITEPELLQLSVIDSLGPGCGGGDGMISFGAAGGTEPYTFEWNDGFDEADRINMGGGDYSVTLSDANGCRDSIDFTFSDGGNIGLNVLVCNAITCGGVSDGSVCATVSAAGNYSFNWEDSDGNNIGSGGQIDNLAAGFYFVTATDGMCTDTDTVFLAPGQTPDVSIAFTPPTCPDVSDGMLVATLTSGTSPATFEWTEPPSTNILSAGAVLSDGVGTYNLNVTDALGCELDTLIEITPPTNTIQVDITNIIENTCFGECEGEATFTASGGPDGNGNYVFFVSNISTPIDPNGDMTTISTLCGGENWVYAIDGICASDTFFFTVPDADPISLVESGTIINPPSCAGGNDGNITIEVQGGDDSSYDIFWVNEGIAGPTLTALEAGEYIYAITDGSNCIVEDTILLEAPDPLQVSVNLGTTVQISCSNDPTGIIRLDVSGGNSGQLTYDWSPDVSNTDEALNLSTGLYSVTVTDSKGCTAETSYELTAAPPVEAVIDVPAEPDCYGETVCIGVESASGGVGDVYSFSINNGVRFSFDTCINVFAEFPILLRVEDVNGCAFDTLLIIGQPEEIIVDAGPDITIDLGVSSDPVSLGIVSELDIDSILWNPTENIDCNTVDCQVVTFSPLATTTYTVTVIDENGCEASDDITVNVDLKRNVFFSNIFSPNGDNANDFFQLATGSGVVEITSFRMYDRWGNMVHEELSYMPDDSVHPGWDGTYNNRPVETGVFVYFAEVLFSDNVRVLYKGDVTLIR